MQRRGFRVYLRTPHSSDSVDFLTAVKASRRLHGGWVQPPSTPALYASFVRRYGGFSARHAFAATHVGLLVCRCEDDAIVGVIIIGEIVRGLFKSAYLGYYAFAPHTGAGYMSEGLELALAMAFRTLKLHRVEANVQPTNLQSLALVRRAGFVREGYSRRYVRIAGRWRDHVRMALLVEEWRSPRKPKRS
jgi:[ribosomal protein S5]-alanine N-acetyltransferase